MKQIAIIIIFLLLFIISCADQIVSSCDPDIPDRSFAAKLSSIQEFVFTTNCALSGCHTGSNPPMGLNLSEGKSYSQLVNIVSNQSSLLRIKPEQSQESWLVRKLRAEGTSVMPPSGKLTTAVIDTIIMWIDNGALDD